MKDENLERRGRLQAGIPAQHLDPPATLGHLQGPKTRLLGLGFLKVGLRGEDSDTQGFRVERCGKYSGFRGLGFGAAG